MRICDANGFKIDALSLASDDESQLSFRGKPVVTVKRIKNISSVSNFLPKTQKAISKLNPSSSHVSFSSALSKAHKMPRLINSDEFDNSEPLLACHFEMTLKKLVILVSDIAEHLLEGESFKRSQIIEMVASALGFNTWNHLKALDSKISHPRSIPIICEFNNQYFKGLPEAFWDLSGQEGSLVIMLHPRLKIRFSAHCNPSESRIYSPLEFTPHVAIRGGLLTRISDLPEEIATN